MDSYYIQIVERQVEELPLKNDLDCGGRPGSSESYLPIRAEIFHQPHSLHSGISTCPPVTSPAQSYRARTEMGNGGAATTQILPNTDKSL